jgi:hypothetical protein
MDGRLSFGTASETSCFLMLDGSPAADDSTWPFALYPGSGTVEVVFQHMGRRPVFDDPELREQFRQRLETAGLPIPAVKLNLRPSFRTDLLLDPPVLAAVLAALEWFLLTYQTRLVRRAADLAGAQPAEVLGLL